MNDLSRSSRTQYVVNCGGQFFFPFEGSDGFRLCAPISSGIGSRFNFTFVPRSGEGVGGLRRSVGTAQFLVPWRVLSYMSSTLSFCACFYPLPSQGLVSRVPSGLLGVSFVFFVL